MSCLLHCFETLLHSRQQRTKENERRARQYAPITPHCFAILPTNALRGKNLKLCGVLCGQNPAGANRFVLICLTSGHMSNAFSLRCIYLSCKVLYFILSDDDFEIKSKIYSFNLRLVLKHILHSQDVFFWNLLFTLLYVRSLT